MSWIRSIFSSSAPAETEAVPEIVSKSWLRKLLDEEAEALTRVGLPVPKRLPGVKNRARTLDKFEIPSYFHSQVCSVKFPYAYYPHKGHPPNVQLNGVNEEVAFFEMNSNEKDRMRYHATGTTYCLLAEPDIVKEAEGLSSQNPWGIDQVVEQFPDGIWLTRDPYTTYREINDAHYLHDSKGTPELDLPPYLKAHASPVLDPDPAMPLDEWLLPKQPLERVAGFTLEELSLFQTQKYTVSLLTADIVRCPTPCFDTETQRYENVLLQTQLPDSYLNMHPSSVWLKVKPSGPLRSTMSEQWWHSLHGLQYPLAFSLTSTPESQYFLIGCSEPDQAYVRRQIATHLPEFSVDQVEESNWDIFTHGFNVSPLYQHEHIKTLSSFPFDPYHYFFSRVDDPTLPGDFSVRFTVYAKPLKNNLANSLVQAIEGTKIPSMDKHLKPEARQRISRVQQGLARKTPPWAMCLCFDATAPEPVSKIARDFLQQYELGEQGFQYPPEAQPLDDLVYHHWSLFSAAELAALAHFPMEL